MAKITITAPVSECPCAQTPAIMGLESEQLNPPVPPTMWVPEAWNLVTEDSSPGDSFSISFSVAGGATYIFTAVDGPVVGAREFLAGGSPVDAINAEPGIQGLVAATSSSAGTSLFWRVAALNPDVDFTISTNGDIEAQPAADYFISRASKYRRFTYHAVCKIAALSATDSMPSLDPNILLVIDPWASGIWTELATLRSDFNELGQGSLDLSTYTRGFLRPPAPDLVAGIAAIENSVVNVRADIYEAWDGALDTDTGDPTGVPSVDIPTRVLLESKLFAFIPGVEADSNPYTQVYDEDNNLQIIRALTGSPDRALFYRGQCIMLFPFVVRRMYGVSGTRYQVRAKYNFASGATQTVTVGTMPQGPSVPHLCQFAPNLDATETLYNELVRSIDMQLWARTTFGDPYELVCQRNYELIETIDPMHTRQILYRTGMGTFDILPCVSAEQYAFSPSPVMNQSGTREVVVMQDGKPSTTISTGVRALEYRRLFEDFQKTNEAYLIESQGIVPIVIASSNIDVSEETRSLELTFSFRPADQTPAITR